MRILASILFCALLAGAPAAQAGEMILYSDATNDITLPSGRADKVGDQIYWNSPLQDESGKQVGIGIGMCHRVGADDSYICSTVLTLPEGNLAAIGYRQAQDDKDTWTITGGTHVLAHTAGWFTSVRLEDPARYRYEMHFEE